MNANEVIDNIASKTDECILFLSLGKDSLVLLDLIYPKFKRVVCVFMYFVKGLSHIQRYAGFVKARYPNIEFVEVPHWTLTYLFRGGVYCEPRKVKVMKLRDVVDSVKRKYGIEYVFLGMKKAEALSSYVVLTFDTAQAMDNFLMRFGYPPNQQYIKGEEFDNRCEVSYD